MLANADEIFLRLEVNNCVSYIKENFQYFGRILNINHDERTMLVGNLSLIGEASNFECSLLYGLKKMFYRPYIKTKVGVGEILSIILVINSRDYNALSFRCYRNSYEYLCVQTQWKNNGPLEIAQSFVPACAGFIFILHRLFMCLSEQVSKQLKEFAHVDISCDSAEFYLFSLLVNAHKSGVITKYPMQRYVDEGNIIRGSHAVEHFEKAFINEAHSLDHWLGTTWRKVCKYFLFLSFIYIYMYI
jgi:hypothetical protein